MGEQRTSSKGCQVSYYSVAFSQLSSLSYCKVLTEAAEKPLLSARNTESCGRVGALKDKSGQCDDIPSQPALNERTALQ